MYTYQMVSPLESQKQPAPIPDPYLVHLCSRREWEAALATGEYRAGSITSVGFIHLSRPAQILAVANRFYAGAPDLLLLWIDPLKVRPEVRWEAADGELFPHLYGPLDLEAVASLDDFPPDTDGVFRRLPAGPKRQSVSQLRMGFTRFEGLPAPQPPPGYRLRGFCPGDEPEWIELLSSGDFGVWHPARLARMLDGGRAPLPLDGIFFATADDKPVATACTFLWPVEGGGEIAELGWVAVHPAQRRHGLGALVCRAVLDYVKDLGYRYIFLLTEDYRLPAIRMYLQLGFEPEITHPSHVAWWQNLKQTLRSSPAE